MIFHIANPKEYNAIIDSHALEYKPAAFDSEGFIHCSTSEQIAGTLDKHFKSADRLIILAIDTEAEKEYTRFENLSGSGQDFPHIYRPLSVSSILDAWLMDRNEDGGFDIPYQWMSRFH